MGRASNPVDIENASGRILAVRAGGKGSLGRRSFESFMRKLHSGHLAGTSPGLIGNASGSTVEKAGPLDLVRPAMVPEAYS